MRHRHGLRKLNRTSSHRLAMLRNMTNSLLTHEVIRTTLPKAKELRRVAEPMITLAKEATLANRRLAFNRLRDRDVVTKLFDELGPRYQARPGGYLRILKFGFRVGDNAPMALVGLVDRPAPAADADGTEDRIATAATKQTTGRYARFFLVCRLSAGKAHCDCGAAAVRVAPAPEGRQRAPAGTRRGHGRRPNADRVSAPPATDRAPADTPCGTLSPRPEPPPAPSTVQTVTAYWPVARCLAPTDSPVPGPIAQAGNAQFDDPLLRSARGRTICLRRSSRRGFCDRAGCRQIRALARAVGLDACR